MRLIPWIIALLLCLFHLPVVASYTGVLSFAGGGVPLEVVLYWLLVLGGGLYLIIGMIKPAFKKRGLFTIGNSRCNMQTIEALRRRYTPLQPSEFGLARALIGEYLFIKNAMRQQVKPDTFLDTVVMSSTQDEPERPTFPMASRLAYYVGFKPNMSLRDIKEIFDLIIEAQTSTPPDYSAVVRRTEIYRRRPQLRNMAGWILNTMAMPDFAPYSGRGVNTKIRSDLLAIALHKKTGRPLDIKDYYTNERYRYREEDGVMRHPGRDGRYNTDDDVILGTLLQK